MIEVATASEVLAVTPHELDGCDLQAWIAHEILTAEQACALLEWGTPPRPTRKDTTP